MPVGVRAAHDGRQDLQARILEREPLDEGVEAALVAVVGQRRAGDVEGDQCSFDAFIKRFGLEDAGLKVLAPIVRGADTDRHDLAPEAAGLHALSLGLTTLYDDDHALLAQGLVVYDALYAWATKARGERHDWRPAGA